MSLPPLILLHGALENASDMAPLAALMQRDYDCHLLEFSGHSSNQWQGEFSLPVFAQDLENFLKRLGRSDATIIGHSLGGYVALYHRAHGFPTPVKRVIAYATKIDWSSQTVHSFVRSLSPEVAMLLPSFKAGLERRFGPRAEAVLRETGELIKRLGERDKLSDETLAKIHLPVDMVVGEKDRMVSWEETERCAGLLPQGTAHRLTDSRHEMEHTDLQALAQLLMTSP